MSNLVEKWMNPPRDDLFALARMVTEALKTSVDAGSEEDEAREYLCRIAASRFAEEWQSGRIAHPNAVIMAMDWIAKLHGLCPVCRGMAAMVHPDAPWNSYRSPCKAKCKGGKCSF